MDTMQSPGTFLRIKRRRSDEPFSTLCVQNPGGKRQKHSEDTKNDETAQLFQFVARVPEEHSVDLIGILNKNDKTKTPKLSENLSPLADLKEQKLQRHLQRKRQESPSANKFRVLPAKKIKYEVPASTKLGDEKELSAVEEVEDLFRIYDVVSDSIDKKDIDNVEVRQSEVQKAAHGTSVVFEEDTVTCNSVQMIREKLTLNDSAKMPPEYMYDLYFAPGTCLEAEENMLFIDPLEERLLWQKEIDDASCEIYEDDDDSNDENNWRNDYPDEEWGDNSDEEREYRSDSSDELDAGCNDYRTRQGRLKFDPYYVENEEYDFVAYDKEDM